MSGHATFVGSLFKEKELLRRENIELQSKLKAQQELIDELTSVISSVVELDYMGKDNQGKMALVCREVLKRKEELAKLEAR